MTEEPAICAKCEHHKYGVVNTSHPTYPHLAGKLTPIRCRVRNPDGKCKLYSPVKGLDDAQSS